MSLALFVLHDMLENVKILTTRPGLPYSFLEWFHSLFENESE